MQSFSSSQFRPAEEDRIKARPSNITSIMGSSTALGGARIWPITLLIIFGIVLGVAIVIGTAIAVVNSRDRALADSELQLRNTALILSEQLDRAFQAIDLVQTSVIERMQLLGISSSEDLDRRMSGPDVHQKFKDKIIGLPYIDAVALINADGQLINFSRNWPIPAINIADRDYYKALKSDPSLTSFVSEPMRSRSTGIWNIYLARKVTAPNGEFLGLVLGAIEIAYFEKYFGSIALGKDSAIAMFRHNGTLLARYPRIESIIGRNFVQGPLFQNILLRANDGAMRLDSRIDGRERLVAARSLSHYPIAIAVSATVSAVLANWQTEALVLVSAGGLAIFVIVLVLFSIARRLLHGQKQSEQDLRAQTLKLNVALDNLSQGLLMFDGLKRLVLCNSQYLEMYGLSSNVVKPGCTIEEIIRYRKETGSLSGDVEQYCADIAAAIAKGTTTSRVVTTADGRLIQIVNQPMAGGGWVVTHDDITEKAQADLAISESEKRFSDLFEFSPEGLVLCDSRGVIRLVNSEVKKLFGYDSGELIGQPIEILIPKDAREGHVGLRRRYSQATVRRSMGKAQADIKGLRKDGSVFSADISISPINTAGEKMVCATVRDVTDRKAIEQQLQQAQKMEAVGNLTGGLAHDFNNLLTIIIGNLDVLQNDITGNRPAEQKVETILQASERGADLTRQMLAFSRRQPLQPKRLDINKLVNKVAKLLTRTLGEDIHIDVHTATDLWSVLVDEAQLEAALLNIAINARDAMSRGGTLVIETANVPVESCHAVCRGGLTVGDFVVIKISDTGDGMPPEVLARIFEPFFTTKASDKGTGLGLSMVYGFIKQSAGHISVASEVGKGTTFSLFLSRALIADADADAEHMIQKPVQVAKDGEVILAVDDNPGVREIVVNQLRELGYQVLEAENAQTALEKLDGAAKIDLLFTDIVMPGWLNGKELAEMARSKRPNLKVLFTSGFPGRPQADDADLELGHALLSKPYRKRDLAQAVRKILDGRASLIIPTSVSQPIGA